MIRCSYDLNQRPWDMQTAQGSINTIRTFGLFALIAHLAAIKCMKVDLIAHARSAEEYALMQRLAMGKIERKNERGA